MHTLYCEIPYQDPVDVFSCFSEQQGALLFDSAELRKDCGQYSFIAIEPFLVISSKNSSENPFVKLQQELKKFTQETLPNLPPFQGGAAGYFGYELFQHVENLPLALEDEMRFPDMIVGFYDVVLGFDHLKKQAWIFSTGFPLQEEKARLDRAKERLEKVKAGLPRRYALRNDEGVSVSIISSHFSPEQYKALIKKVIDYILAGDIFEANISQRFRAILPEKLSPFELYKRLRKINPAPFAAFLHFDGWILASASPERFIKVNAGFVETRPIKGTRARGKSEQEDKALAAELLSSEKDYAENIMIVDLLRNDLSRVCEDYSVEVPQLCGLESYSTVHHLVSVVNGKLRKNLTAVDLLQAVFPGGSITGAPKYRAMEIISELEGLQGILKNSFRTVLSKVTLSSCALCRRRGLGRGGF